MATVSDILHRAGRALAYLGRTQTMSAADATDALACFNEMLGSWSNENLMSYVTLQRSFPLVAATQTYTIGSGGSIASARPFAITGAFLRDAQNIDYPIEIYTREQWDSIGQKSISSQLPCVLFYNSEYPLGIINIWPVPDTAYTVFFNSTLDQVEYSLLTTSIAMPVGYELAFVMNLALHMMSFGFPCLLDDKATARLLTNAAVAKGNLKRANTKTSPATYDPAVWGTGAPYNIYSDTYR